MISIKNVSKWYGSLQVLTHCSAEVKKGEVVVVCGPSGSGKSTFIKCVNGLEPFQQGEITVDGVAVNDPKTDLPKLRARIGMVFQNFELFPHMSVTRNLTLAQVKVLGRTQEEATQKGLKLLDRVGLLAHKDKYPGQLSGGQQRPRAARARRPRRPQGQDSRPALGRPAAARRDRPRARNGSDRNAVRRAHLGARPGDDQRGA